MSGGKKAQRTKGNAKPSSSRRAAELLEHGGFIGFSNLAGNSYGYVPQSKSDESELDGDLRLLLRKMMKKDTVTRLKAIQEFTAICKEKDNDTIKNVINFWPRIYNKLTHDFDHRIREAVQQAHHQVTSKTGRDLAPHLKLIITNWLMAQFDVYSPTATAAKLSFDEVFPGIKKKEVLTFCKNEIVETLQSQILKETADTLSDPKTIPIEEREAKFIRYMSSSFLVLQYFIEMLPSELNEKMDINVKQLFAEKKFWKYARNSSPMIRSSFFALLSTCCQRTPELLDDLLSQLCPAVLSNLDEHEPTVVKNLWDAALSCLTTYQTCWNHVNSRKAVFPKLWKLLVNCGYGNVNVVYPNLLPFLSNISKQVIGDGIGFYVEFFNNYFEGLYSKQDVLTSSDTNIIVKAYMECYKYLLLTNLHNEEVVEYLVKTQLRSVLMATFSGSSKRRMWYGALFIELDVFLSFINEQNTVKNLEVVQELLWRLIEDIVIVDGKFRNQESTFFESLVDLLFCLCGQYSTDNREKKPEVNCDIQKQFDGNLFRLVCDILKCYIHEIFENNNGKIIEHFNDIVIKTLNKEVLKYMAEQKKQNGSNAVQLAEDPDDTLSICLNFVNAIILPLWTDVSFTNKSQVLLIGLVQLLHGDDKGKYLDAIFQKTCSSNTRFLMLLSEAFKYQEDQCVMLWLQSDYVQALLNSCIEQSINDDVEGMLILSWKILEVYISVVKSSQQKLNQYALKLLSAIKTHLNKSSKFCGLVVECYAALCATTFELFDDFFETTLAIIQASLLWRDTSHLPAAMRACIHKVLKHENGFEKLVSTISTWAKQIVIKDDHSYSCISLCECLTVVLNVSKEESVNGVVYDAQFFHQLMFNEKQWAALKNKEENSMIKFYSQLFCHLARSDVSSLARYDSKIVVEMLMRIFANKNISTEDVVMIISTFKHLQKVILEEAISRAVNGSNEVVLPVLLQALHTENELTDELLDQSLLLAAPTELGKASAVNTYCVIIQYIDDVSCVRALLEKYVDVLENDPEVKNEVKSFASCLQILTSVLSQWYKIISKTDTNVISNDYLYVITTIMDNLLVWKDDHSDLLLFSNLLIDYETNIVLLNTQLIDLLRHCMKTCAKSFRSEHWDFILCSMVSWLQTCQESLHVRNSRFDVSPFLCATFQLFSVIADLFWTMSTEEEMLPCIATEFATPLNHYNADLITEWQEFFSPAACKSLLYIYSTIVNKGNTDSENETFAKNLCACIKFIPSSAILEFINEDVESEKKKKQCLEAFCNLSCALLGTGKWYFKVTSYQLQARVAGQIEKCLCEDESEKEEESIRKFPSFILDIMESNRDQSFLVLSHENASINSPLQGLNKTEENTSLLTYLLSWQLLLRIFKMAEPNERAKFANYFHKNSHVSDLITCLFCMLPSNMLTTAEISPVLSKLEYAEIQTVAFHLLTSAMECIPALIRLWFNNNTNRKDAGLVDRFVSSYVSPILLRNDFQKLDRSSKEFNNMVVKTRQVAREVVAIYTVDEISMELVVKLSSNHPLSPVSVDCGKRIGVSYALWRQWMLQLTTFLSFQNGTILDGLALWKKNVDKRFEGVEECMVCFSVLHGSNYSLPSIGCKTCKKKFHPSCLYKWFNTSGKSTCPLCRNIF